MVSKEMLALGSKRSCIREIFEFGRNRAAAVGKENVYDFSLGNPSVPAPDAVNAAICEALETMTPIAVHGYTSAPGDDAVRDAIAAGLNKRYGTNYSRRNLYLTCGAAAALTASFMGLTLHENTEFIAIAPYFPEYSVFAAVGGAKLRVIPPDIPDFQIDFVALEAAINENTQALIINSPNNPSGVIYTEATIQRLCDLLRRKEKELGKTLYLISDEPYRELVYDGIELPFAAHYYDNVVVCYSFSKSLSLPGERIGYILIPDTMDDFADVYNAIAGAARAMGYVCAPSLMQRVASRCAQTMPNLAPYIENRDLLYGALTEMGYRCAKPQGAFYLFVEAPGGDAERFCALAKEHDLLLVPGNDFGCPSYMRVSYCVDHDMIKRSLPAFKAAMEGAKVW